MMKNYINDSNKIKAWRLVKIPRNRANINESIHEAKNNSMINMDKLNGTLLDNETIVNEGTYCYKKVFIRPSVVFRTKCNKREIKFYF